jgi:solute:Na+ symporter, SSS family
MILSGLFPSRDAAYRQRVADFFQRLSRPLSEAEKPRVDPAFRRALMVVLAAALAGTGLLFVGMGLPSAAEFSGRLTFGAGSGCLILAAAVYLVSRPTRALAEEA